MLNELDIDLEDLEARLYSQVYHVSLEDSQTPAQSTGDNEVTNDLRTKRTTSRYYETGNWNNQQQGMYTFRNDTGNSGDFVPVGNDAATYGNCTVYQNGPALDRAYNRQPNLTPQIINMVNPINNIVVVPPAPAQITSDFLSGSAVVNKNLRRFIEREEQRQKRLEKQREKRKERRRRRKEKEWLERIDAEKTVVEKFTSPKKVEFKMHHLTPTNHLSSKDEVINLSESDSDSCIEVQESSELVILSSDEDYEVHHVKSQKNSNKPDKGETDNAGGRNSKKTKTALDSVEPEGVKTASEILNDNDDDIIFIEPPPADIIEIDIDPPQTLINLHSKAFADADGSSTKSTETTSTNSADTFLKAPKLQTARNKPNTSVRERRELLGTPDSAASNDFLDNPANLPQNKFNFGLHGSDFCNSQGFLKPKSQTEMYETESSCSTSDISTPIKTAVFNEVDFEQTNKKLFDQINLENFGYYITPNRGNSQEIVSLLTPDFEQIPTKATDSRRKLYDGSTSSDSSSESEYGDNKGTPARKIKHNLPTLSHIQAVDDVVKTPKKIVKKKNKEHSEINIENESGKSDENTGKNEDGKCLPKKTKTTKEQIDSSEARNNLKSHTCGTNITADEKTGSKLGKKRKSDQNDIPAEMSAKKKTKKSKTANETNSAESDPKTKNESQIEVDIINNNDDDIVSNNDDEKSETIEKIEQPQRRKFDDSFELSSFVILDETEADEEVAEQDDDEDDGDSATSSSSFSNFDDIGTDMMLANCETTPDHFRKSTEPRKPKQFADYWTSDADRFHNRSWGLENFDVEETRKTMSVTDSRRNLCDGSISSDSSSESEYGDHNGTPAKKIKHNLPTLSHIQAADNSVKTPKKIVKKKNKEHSGTNIENEIGKSDENAGKNEDGKCSPKKMKTTKEQLDSSEARNNLKSHSCESNITADEKTGSELDKKSKSDQNVIPAEMSAKKKTKKSKTANDTNSAESDPKTKNERQIAVDIINNNDDDIVNNNDDDKSEAFEKIEQLQRRKCDDSFELSAFIILGETGADEEVAEQDDYNTVKTPKKFVKKKNKEHSDTNIENEIGKSDENKGKNEDGKCSPKKIQTTKEQVDSSEARNNLKSHSCGTHITADEKTGSDLGKKGISDQNDIPAEMSAKKKTKKSKTANETNSAENDPKTKNESQIEVDIINNNVVNNNDLEKSETIEKIEQSQRRKFDDSFELSAFIILGETGADEEVAEQDDDNTVKTPKKIVKKENKEHNDANIENESGKSDENKGKNEDGKCSPKETKATKEHIDPHIDPSEARNNLNSHSCGTNIIADEKTGSELGKKRKSDQNDMPAEMSAKKKTKKSKKANETNSAENDPKTKNESQIEVDIINNNDDDIVNNNDGEKSETIEKIEQPQRRKFDDSFELSAFIILSETGADEEVIEQDDDEDDSDSATSSSSLSDFDGIGSDMMLANCEASPERSRKSTEPKKAKQFADYWTSDADRFHNRSWGLENFDVEETRKTMSDDPNLWKVLERDRVFIRLSTPRGQRCRRCREIGHLVRHCKNRPVIPCCILCGVKGHQETRCPYSMCTECGRPGIYTTSCSQCAYKRNFQCKICRLYGHVDANCPDLWRRYHLTTKPGPIVTSETQAKPFKDRWCSGCARSGHYEYNCRYFFNREHFCTDTEVKHYFDIYDFPKKQATITLQESVAETSEVEVTNKNQGSNVAEEGIETKANQHVSTSLECSTSKERTSISDLTVTVKNTEKKISMHSRGDSVKKSPTFPPLYMIPKYFQDQLSYLKSAEVRHTDEINTTVVHVPEEEGPNREPSPTKLASTEISESLNTRPMVPSEEDLQYSMSMPLAKRKYASLCSNRGKKYMNTIREKTNVNVLITSNPEASTGSGCAVVLSGNKHEVQRAHPLINNLLKSTFKVYRISDSSVTLHGFLHRNMQMLRSTQGNCKRIFDSIMIKRREIEKGGAILKFKNRNSIKALFSTLNMLLFGRVQAQDGANHMETLEVWLRKLKNEQDYVIPLATAIDIFVAYTYVFTLRRSIDEYRTLVEGLNFHITPEKLMSTNEILKERQYSVFVNKSRKIIANCEKYNLQDALLEFHNIQRAVINSGYSKSAYNDFLRYVSYFTKNYKNFRDQEV